MSAHKVLEFTQTRSVLLVDDEVDTLKILGSILQRLFKNVYLTTDGVQALEKLRDENYHIDLIISDVNMPIMNGISLYEKLQELNIDTPFVFITANQELKYAIEYNVPYLKKPMNLNSFYEMLLNTFEK